MPFDAEHTAPLGLQFAAERAAARAASINQRRNDCAVAVRELSDRLLPVSAALRAYQADTVKAVAGRTHVALIAVLGWLIGWPDVTLAKRFVCGFALAGRMERTGVFEAKDGLEPRSVQELLGES